MRSVIDLPALMIALVVAAVLAASLLYADRGNRHRRSWAVAGILALALIVLSAIEILPHGPLTPKLSTPIVASILDTLATLGMVRATRRVPMWARALLVFVTALVMLLGGLLLGASYVSPLLPF